MAKGMLDGRDQPAAGLEHPPQLGERQPPVLQVVQHQGRGDVVESVVGEGKRAAKVGHPQVRAVTEPPPGDLDHPALLSKPVTMAPRSRSAATSGSAPQPASRIRRPATSPARASLAGRS